MEPVVWFPPPGMVLLRYLYVSEHQYCPPSEHAVAPRCTQGSRLVSREGTGLFPVSGIQIVAWTYIF